MKKIIKIILVVTILFINSTVFADTTIHLSIKTDTNSLYNQDITVAPCDSDNVGTLKISAYCAILQTGHPNVWDWTWAPGAFLTSFDGISGYTSKDRNNNDVYHYWSWFLNGTEGSEALNQYVLQPNDLISLTFIDPIDTTPIVSSGGPLLTSPDLVSPSPQIIEKNIFNTKEALDFLIAQQKEDGSFGEDLYTDWVTLALSSNEGFQNQKTKLKTYFEKLDTKNYQLTDYERHTMALLSLGVNPYNFNGENYIKKITDSFDGKQFGDAGEDNDDIFALIVLQNAGYTKDESIIKDTITFIINKQREDGSWDKSVDMTGAAMQSLSAFSPTPGVGESLKKAKDFLEKNQKDTGGWNNVSSTSWAIEGILALSLKPEGWIKNNNTPLDYLGSIQDINGGTKNDYLQNKIWETAYVVTALSGKTWNQIMQKFEKPQEKLMEQNKEESLPVEQKIEKSVVEIPTKIVKTLDFKKEKQKIIETSSQNTANVINAITDSLVQKTELIKKGWFKNFLDKIFSIF